MRKKAFTLIGLLIVIVIIAFVGFWLFKLGVWIFGGGGKEELRTTGPSPYENKLRSTSEIEIKEKVLSVGKHYDIFVGGEKVAEVTGKALNVWGDVFTLKTVDKKKLAYEEECVKFLSLNRAAVCYDSQGSITGYLGEEAWKDFFKWGHIFHFYDINKKEVGKSEKRGNASWNKHRLYDSEGNVDYDVDKKFTVVSDRYILTRIDFESSIPFEHAIFVTCIEDAIADAQASESSKSSDD